MFFFLLLSQTIQQNNIKNVLRFYTFLRLQDTKEEKKLLMSEARDRRHKSSSKPEVMWKFDGHITQSTWQQKVERLSMGYSSVV